jgi:hypothetical protein
MTETRKRNKEEIGCFAYANYVHIADALWPTQGKFFKVWFKYVDFVWFIEVQNLKINSIDVKYKISD